MKAENKSSTVYYCEYSDDLVKTNNQEIKLPKNYCWLRKNIFYKIAAQILYAIAFVFGLIYTKLVLHIKCVNRKALKQCKNGGYFLYGNHTQPVGDVFSPALILFPKRMYAIASVANLGIPVIGKLLPLIGAIFVPESLEHMKDFIAAVKNKIENKNVVVIYPEAHVWPYCNFIRPFPTTAFRYPVVLDVPSFCMTTTYQKRKFSSKPKITVYIDGPFFANKESNKKEEQIRLHDEIYECMKNRSKFSTYEYVKYEKESVQ